jgi:hypothetical protein
LFISQKGRGILLFLASLPTTIQQHLFPFQKEALGGAEQPRGQSSDGRMDRRIFTTCCPKPRLSAPVMTVFIGGFQEERLERMGFQPL